jgi:hypothetical protein
MAGWRGLLVIGRGVLLARSMHGLLRVGRVVHRLAGMAVHRSLGMVLVVVVLCLLLVVWVLVVLGVDELGMDGPWLWRRVVGMGVEERVGVRVVDEGGSRMCDEGGMVVVAVVVGGDLGVPAGGGVGVALLVGRVTQPGDPHPRQKSISRAPPKPARGMRHRVPPADRRRQNRAPGAQDRHPPRHRIPHHHSVRKRRRRDRRRRDASRWRPWPEIVYI